MRMIPVAASLLGVIAPSHVTVRAADAPSQTTQDDVDASLLEFLGSVDELAELLQATGPERKEAAPGDTSADSPRTPSEDERTHD